MVRIRRFSVIRTANVVALIYAIVVAIFAVPFLLLFSLASSSIPRGATRFPVPGVGEVLVFALFAIIAYGIAGWIFTAIGCLIYNLAAKWAGGIEVEVERFERMPPMGPASWGQGPYGQGQWQQGPPQWQQPGVSGWPGSPAPGSSWPPSGPGPGNPGNPG